MGSLACSKWWTRRRLSGHDGEWQLGGAQGGDCPPYHRGPELVELAYRDHVCRALRSKPMVGLCDTYLYISRIIASVAQVQIVCIIFHFDSGVR